MSTTSKPTTTHWEGKPLMPSERMKLVKKADTYFSLYIRQRDGHCVTCGTKENLQCGHLFSRNAYSTRWDEKNAFGQCGSCNLSHEHDPYPLTKYFLTLFGEEEYDRLHAKHRQAVKFSNADLEALAQKYKSKCRGE